MVRWTHNLGSLQNSRASANEDHVKKMPDVIGRDASATPLSCLFSKKLAVAAGFLARFWTRIAISQWRPDVRARGEEPGTRISVDAR
jgi:hypothetical protein